VTGQAREMLTRLSAAPPQPVSQTPEI
jgi:hypothetical protein